MRSLVLSFFCFAALAARGAELPPLNSPATTDYYPGKFVWGDLFTADPPAAQRFYAGLFGWTAVTIDQDTPAGVQAYTVLSVGDRPIAGIVLRPARTKDEEHGRWIGYVSVPDVTQALATANGDGGRVFSRAKDLPRRGAQAVLIDREGAMLGVMHSSTGDPGEYLPELGDWTWAELFARDPRAAGLFYQEVVGYSLIPDGRTDQPGHLVLASGGYSRAGVVTATNRPKARPAWLLFVRVASVKDAVARAVSLGGRVLVPPSDLPTDYWRAVIADPTGASLGLVELEDPGTAKEKPQK